MIRSLFACSVCVAVAVLPPWFSAEAGQQGSNCPPPNTGRGGGGGGGAAAASAVIAGTSQPSKRAARASDWNSPIAVPQRASVGISVDLSAAVAGPINPSTVDETFRGFVQLSIAAIEIGGTVRVEKFQVNNATGAIDSAAILEQSFLLTDGQSNVIGGVANTNVPADTTGADGNIVAQLSFLDRSVPTTVAEYVFRFSSPTNAFAPQTARFTVTDAADAQKFTGTVLNNGAPVPFAHVVLLDAGGGGYDFVAATVADAAGVYSLGAQAGQYDLVAAKRGFVGAFGQGVGRELVQGANQPAPLTMVPGTRTISGQLGDRDTNAGLPGVQVVFLSQDGKFTVDYTDAAGNFATAVTPGEWDVEVERDALHQAGYLVPSQPRSVDTSAGNVGNINISFPKATALLYGKVTDSNGATLAGAEVDAVTEDSEFESYTTTDQSGNYVIAVNSGVWFVAPTSGPLQDTDYLSPDPQTPFVEDAQAIAIDFSVTKSNARLGGLLRDEDGSPVSDVTFFADEISGKALFTNFTTEEPDGAFEIGLTNGTWQLTPDFDEAADTDLIFRLPTAVTFAANQTITGLDLRVQEPTRHIIVQVNDDAGDPYEFARVEILIEVENSTYLAFATTDEDGEAQLPAFDGNWTLYLPGPELEADGFREPEPMQVNVNGSDPVVEVQLELLPETGNTLVNLATRGVVQTGENVLIGGFIITGSAPKELLIRAIGPSLSGSGVNGALADPTLMLFDSNGAPIAFNDDWKTNANRQAIIDTTIPPTNDKEAALLQTLQPGAYTARLGGAGNATGIALVEIYDLDSELSSRLVNIATRGRVQTDENLLIGGYIVGGYQDQTLVIRAIGPSLKAGGVADALADPFLTVFDAQGTALATNNNWQDTQRQQLIDTTLAPTHPDEAALVLTLSPASYTAVVSGVNNTTGVGLVEIYNITPAE